MHAEESGFADDAARRGQLEAFFRRTLLEHPTADAEIPSLVYEEGDEIVGFLGSYVRPMRFDDRRIRIGCSAHLLAHPRVRPRGVGGLLLRQYLSGPQDLSITDGANEPVRKLWERLGGTTVHVSCFAYFEVLRPVGLGLNRALARSRLGGLEGALRPVASLLDVPARRLRKRPRTSALPEPSEQLTPELLVSCLPHVTEELRLIPEYDVAYLEWLFGELEAVRKTNIFPRLLPRGGLLAELVRREGRVAGWYVCQIRRGGLCRVLQVAAAPGDSGVVLEQLSETAIKAGATGLYGRIEPRLVGPLSIRRPFVRFGGGRMLAHGERDVVDALLRGEAMLTRLDGEWW